MDNTDTNKNPEAGQGVEWVNPGSREWYATPPSQKTPAVLQLNHYFNILFIFNTPTDIYNI